MAFEPTVKPKSVKSPSYSDTQRGRTSTSRHSLNVFKNLEQDNYISRHRGLTPPPSASGALGTFDLKMPSPVSESLPRASINTSRTPSDFGTMGSLIDPRAAKLAGDAISDAFTERRVQQTIQTHGIDATRQSPGSPTPLGENAPRPFFGQNTAHPGL